MRALVCSLMLLCTSAFGQYTTDSSQNITDHVQININRGVALINASGQMNVASIIAGSGNVLLTNADGTINLEALEQDGATTNQVLAWATVDWVPTTLTTSLIPNLSGVNTGDEVQATTSLAGIAELATTAEVNTGTDTIRAVTPASLTDVLSDISGNIANVVEDTTPELGGDLATNGFGVTGPLTIDDEISITEGANDPLEVYHTIVSDTSSGLVSGGIISLGTGSDEFSISDGTGYVTDSYTDGANPTFKNVIWTGITNVTAVITPSANVVWLSIDSAGSVVQQTTPHTREQRRDSIVLGTAFSVDGVNLIGVTNNPAVATSTSLTLYDLLDVLGDINESGNGYSAGTLLGIDKAAGTTFLRGSNFPANTKDPNFINSGSGSDITFIYVYDDGTGETTSVPSQTEIDPDQYDDGSGTLQSVGNNKWTNQRMFFFPDVGLTIIQYGQVQYSSLAGAEAGADDEDFLILGDLNPQSLRTTVSVKKSETDLNSASTSFTHTGKFGFGLGGGASGSSASQDLQATYDLSVTPEITTDATRGAFTLKRGSSLDTDDVLDILNGSDAQVFSVTGEGTIVGLNVDSTNKTDIAAKMANLSEDLTPTLGGPLDPNGEAIIGNVTVTAADAVIQLDNTSASSQITRTMPGIEILTKNSGTSNPWHAGIKFLCSDTSFTTENPKFLAAILPRATEAYSLNTKGGMAIDFAVTANLPGSTTLPIVSMTLNEDGNLELVNELEVGGQITAGSGFEIITSAIGEIQLAAIEDGGASVGQFLKWDGATYVPATLTGGGDALVGNPLSQFAATTSGQFSGVISDETGTGVVALSISPSFTTPDLGTPSALVATNVTGTAASLTAGMATNLSGGAVGQLPYQSAANTTALLAVGTAGQVLQSNASAAPTWVTPNPIPSQTWVINSPAIGGVFGAYIDTNRVIDKIMVWTDTGTVDLNVEIRTAPNSSGTNTISSDVQATSSGVLTTIFADDSVSTGEWLHLDISAIASSPTMLGVTVTYE